MSERHGVRADVRGVAHGGCVVAGALRHLIEALRARILTSIDPVNATGGQA
jgi:hypothetical protein